MPLLSHHIEYRSVMRNNYFENDFAEFWFDDQVLYFIYKPGIFVNLEAAKRIVFDRIKLQNGKAYPVLCDMRGVKDSDKPARDYLAKEGSELVKAVAVIIESPVSRIMGNFYLTINQPLTPTRLFTDKGQAAAYLEQYITR